MSTVRPASSTWSRRSSSSSSPIECGRCPRRCGSSRCRTSRGSTRPATTSSSRISIPDDKELTPQLLAERQKVALEHEQLPGFLVSKDGKTAVIYGWLRPTKTGKGANEYNDFAANFRALEALKKEFAGRGDHKLYTNGYPVTQAWTEIFPPQAMQKLLPVMLVALLVLLFVFFRRLSAVLLPIAVVVPSIIATNGLAGWVGIPLNHETINTPNILLVIGVACVNNTLHTFYRALDHGLSRRDAARYSLHETLGSTFFASVAVSLGFLSLLTMTLPPFHQLGVLVAAGSMIVWLFTYLILGSLLVFLPIKAKRRKDEPVEDVDPEALRHPAPMAVRLTEWISRNRLRIVAGWVALCGVSVWLAVRTEVSLDQRGWYYGEMLESYDFVRDNLGYTEAFEVVIEAGEEEGIKDPAFLGKVDQFATWLRSQQRVVQVTSLVNILKETNRALFGGDANQYRLPDTRRGVADQYFLYTMSLPMGKNLNDRVTLSNDALRMTVFSRGETSPNVVKLVEGTRAKAKEMGLNVQVTGRAVLFNLLNPEMVPSFIRSLFTGTIFIAAALLLFFRSVRLGLLSLITNLVPVVIGAGLVLTIIGQSYDMPTIATFTMVLSVSVDDTVHFLESYDRHRQLGFGRKDSIARVWTMVGPPMLSTTLILAGGFALFTLSEFSIARDFGTVMSLTLIFNFFADFMLGPALLLLFPSLDKAARAALHRSKK